MLEYTKKPVNAGGPYGPFALTSDPAVQLRVLAQARRYRWAVVLGALRGGATAIVRRVRVAALSAGRFVFDHGGLRSVHH